MSDHETVLRNLHQAAEAIAAAEGLLIAAGAGMGVDSGLPDFRGDQGFWRAYPAYQHLGLNFVALANPRWFASDPSLAWGFYGHRYNLYAATPPHAGFNILRSWRDRMHWGAFVYTSNVDGHFQKAGFDPDRILEVHGSIGWMQCLKNVAHGLFPFEEGTAIPVDEATMRALEPLPKCPKCCALARPNILMFGDPHWDSRRSDAQAARLQEWLEMLRGRRLVIVECGAGTAVPTVRWFCESIAAQFASPLIRINVREPNGPDGVIGLPLSAETALQRIDAYWKQTLV